jgi:hAT family C-terminal dimerisation region
MLILKQMSMYSQDPKRKPTLMQKPALCDASAASLLSEKKLNKHILTIRTMRAKLKGASNTGNENGERTEESEEDRRRVAEAARRAIEMELSDYTAEPLLEASTDASFQTILSYWKVCDHVLHVLNFNSFFTQMRENRYPHLFMVAMTVLAIPATSVPSERVFSSSGRTDTAARNRLSPFMMEALQVLKFNQRNKVLDFRSAFMDDPMDLEAVTVDEMSDGELREEILRAQVVTLPDRT